MHRILGSVGSPRPGGNTELLMDRLLAAAQLEAVFDLGRRLAQTEVEFS